MSHGTLLQECRYRLRRHRFEELARTDPVSAVQYLQTDVFEAVDHSSPDRKREVVCDYCACNEQVTSFYILWQSEANEIKTLTSMLVSSVCPFVCLYVRALRSQFKKDLCT